MNSESNNKVIAKNTVMLYVRMFFILTISLYTSRLVLNVLGVNDFGIYNVVGGIVVVFSFLNGALASATQRFLAVELGRDDIKRLKEVFSASIHVHITLALFIIFLGETIGLWFLNNQLVIPDNRIYAANWIYQFSIFTCVFQLLIVPYHGTVAAHEKMNVYAWLSIMDVFLKLFMVLLISLLSSDRLILYGFVMMLISMLDLLVYLFYTKQFEEVGKLSKVNPSQYKEFGKFTGWTLLGSVSNICHTQGVNILLNVFFGPAVNAARAIGVQVLAAAHLFVFNFQLAATPQITKNYSSGNLDRMHFLIFMSSKMSFFLTLLITIPLILETPFLLRLWLGNVPEYTVIFVRFVIITMLLDSTAGPLETSANATGHIKTYQLLVNGTIIMIIPISWLFLRNGFPPQTVYIVHLAIVFLVQYLRILIVLPMISLPFSCYFRDIIFRLILVSLLAIILPYYVYFIMTEGFIRFLIVGIVSVVTVSYSMYLFGLKSNEREMMIDSIKFFLNKKIHKK